MATDNIRMYQDALTWLSETESNVERNVNAIREIGYALLYWKEVSVFYENNQFPFQFLREPNIDISNLPNPKQLFDSLLAYQYARFDAQTAYNAIPLENRSGIEPPGK